MAEPTPFDPKKQQTSPDLIPVIKYRYLIDIRTFCLRISKMPMQIIIDRFLRHEKSHEYELTIFECSLLSMLASYMGDNLNCWPSFKTLAENCRMSEKSVERYIASLENKKLLKITRIKNKKNDYEFTNLILDLMTEIVDNSKINKKTTVSQTACTVSQSVQAPSDSLSNNIKNNIKNNNKGKSYPQDKKHTAAPTAKKPSPLLEEFISKTKEE